ncbi:MAG: hypothetical protein WAM97_10860 [Acidimicrobiales bacterium]
MNAGKSDGLVAGYLELGLATGRHIDGFVDAYYGPPETMSRISAEPVRPPERLVHDARALVSEIDAGAALEASSHAGDTASDASRRRWLRAQVVGILTTARKLAGEDIAYADEVEACYGVRPHPVEWDEVAEAHKRLESAVPGNGSLAERVSAWREAHAVDPAKLLGAIEALAEDLLERTDRLFGVPDDARCDFELVTDKPWSGFNTYLGGLRSRVDINTDLPVLSLSLPHLVAHEAYPGHHTEHTRKEVGLVRNRKWLEETIFLVGTPQCLLAEGLADLGLSVVMGDRYEQIVAPHFRSLGIRYDADVAAEVSEASQLLSSVRATAAWRLHAEGVEPEQVVSELERWALLSHARAEKAVEFLLHPTWRAYITCYVEGYALCRKFVGGDPTRFARLLNEQLIPADLAEAA